MALGGLGVNMVVVLGVIMVMGWQVVHGWRSRLVSLLRGVVKSSTPPLSKWARLLCFL